jgi:hypothetical protein
MKLLKRIVTTVIVLGLGTGVGWGVFYSAYTSLTVLPTAEEISDPQNVSRHLPLEERLSVKKSRQSTVQVLSLSFDGAIASSTGTYITSDDRHYVLTVAHGLVGPCDTTKIYIPEAGPDSFYDCIGIPVFDPLIDYAIIEIDELPLRAPINIKRSLPRANQWRDYLASQTKVYYTGYPNSNGPFTVPGTIVGYDSSDYIYLYSYAFGGASGSGVFTTDGKLIGYLLAIDVGSTEFGVQVIESIVVVVPVFKVDWASIL